MEPRDETAEEGIERVASDLSVRKRKHAVLDERIDEEEKELNERILNSFVSRIKEKIGFERVENSSDCPDRTSFWFRLENGGILTRSHHLSNWAWWSYAEKEGDLSTNLGIVSDADSYEEIYDAQQSFGLDNLEHLAEIENEFAMYITKKDEFIPNYSPVKRTVVESFSYSI